MLKISPALKGFMVITPMPFCPASSKSPFRLSAKPPMPVTWLIQPAAVNGVQVRRLDLRLERAGHIDHRVLQKISYGLLRPYAVVR
jgi:hypothetical protein